MTKCIIQLQSGWPCDYLSAQQRRILPLICPPRSIFYILFCRIWIAGGCWILSRPSFRWFDQLPKTRIGNSVRSMWSEINSFVTTTRVVSSCYMHLACNWNIHRLRTGEVMKGDQHRVRIHCLIVVLDYTVQLVQICLRRLLKEGDPFRYYLNHILM